MTVTFPLSRPRAKTFVWPLVSGYCSNRISQFAFNAIRQHCLEISEKKSLKRKITTKSLEEKYKALKDIESGIAEKKVATKYKIPLNTLFTWVKSKEKISAALENVKSPKTMKRKGAGFDTLDKAIYKWFINAREQNVPVSGTLLKKKAIRFARELQIEDFMGSDGWLDRWKTRHRVAFKMIAGEAKSCTPQMTSSWDETTLPTIISNYRLEDIYNADEFGLFYQALPDKTLHLKSEKCVGGKHSKTRLTVLVWLLQILRVISCRCSSLANLQDQGVLLALETYPADTDRKKRVGWTALCAKSGSGSLIERLWGKAEKMHLSWIIARPTHALKDLRPFS